MNPRLKYLLSFGRVREVEQMQQRFREPMLRLFYEWPLRKVFCLFFLQSVILLLTFSSMLAGDDDVGTGQILGWLGFSLFGAILFTCFVIGGSILHAQLQADLLETFGRKEAARVFREKVLVYRKSSFFGKWLK